MPPGRLRRRAVTLALALALLAPFTPLLPPAEGAGCSVPCGYIYPRLLFSLGERGRSYELTSGEPLDLEGTLTFTWDMTAEGVAPHNPANPIVVTFSYPRKPDWLSVEVEPAQIEVPISPQFVEATPTAGGVQMVYRYTAPIEVAARLTAQPLVDPEQPPRLILLAQSSESGLYKPGFGVRALPLALPEALVAAQERPRAQDLRIGEPAPLALPPLSLAFQGAEITLEAAEPIEVWKPVLLRAAVRGPRGPARALDMAASVVGEANEVLYTTGLRHRPDGILEFAFTFPGPGHHRVLLAARPVAGVSEPLFEPVVAEFDVVLPGAGFDALRYPDAYRARYAEPSGEVHANPADLPRQFEKAYGFPVLAGADSVAVQVQLGSSAGSTLGAGSVFVEVLDPLGEQVGYGKLDAVTPVLDLRLRAPLPAGDYRVRLYGTAANPLGLGGSSLDTSIGVFYPERPVGRVSARGEPRALPGGAVALGTGTIELELLLHDEPALWSPVHALLVAKDAQGRVALHPDFILTVRGPEELGLEGNVLYTTGHRHPHDGLLNWSVAFPRPGLYVVSAFAAPTPEASGTFWEPAIASWPIRIPAPADGLVRYPARYEALYHDSTSSVRSGAEPYGYAFEKRYPVPVLEGAERLAASLSLMTMAMVQIVEGAGPAALNLELLGPGGEVLASQPVVAAGGASVEASAPQPGLHWVRVAGQGYAPLDYSGAMYALGVEVAYPEGPSERLGPAEAPPAPEEPAEPRLLPGFEPALLALAAAVVLALAARRRGP